METTIPLAVISAKASLIAKVKEFEINEGRLVIMPDQNQYFFKKFIKKFSFPEKLNKATSVWFIVFSKKHIFLNKMVVFHKNESGSVFSLDGQTFTDPDENVLMEQLYEEIEKKLEPVKVAHLPTIKIMSRFEKFVWTLVILVATMLLIEFFGA